MKKNVVRLFAVSVALTLLLGACGGSGGTAGDSTGTGNPTSNSEQSTATAAPGKDGGNEDSSNGTAPEGNGAGADTQAGNEVGNGAGNETGSERVYHDGFDVTGMPDIELQDKTVTVYSWGEDYVPTFENDWEAHRFTDYYGGKVEVIVGTGDYYENLYKLIAAGDIPDIVVGEAKSFPRLIMRDLVQAWDSYLAYDDPIWKTTGANETIESMRWDGKIYNLTGQAHLLGVMFYNKRIVSETGLDDPMELQANGEWDWNAFQQYIDECTQDVDGDGAIDINGFVQSGDFALSFIASTGETHILYDSDNNTFVNNLKSEKVRAAADFLYNMGPNVEGYMSMADPTFAFLSGKAAFVYTNDYRGYIDYEKLWKTDGIGIVPLPKYPGADKQYQTALPDNWWLMKGARNPEGAALLMLAQQYDSILNNDPSVSSPREQSINSWLSHGFTQEAAEAVVDIQSMPRIPLFARCIYLADGAIEYRAIDTPWSTLADTVSGELDAAIATTLTPLAK